MYLYQFALTFSPLFKDYKCNDITYFHLIHGNILLSIQILIDISSFKNLYYLLLGTFFIR